MPEIRVLDPHVADLIAAGEVVERPASVVKELMENAIDAGAGSVTVEIAHGGMSLIRVTDDGCGIPREQLATAFLRHATSKLRSARDLEAIGTLGFRGEALAAIAAVARVEVLTRTAEEELGSALTLEAGVPGQVEEAGCPTGTTMVVRDLFFNTPARLKFMKKDSAEGAAVFAAVQRQALAHPEVSVKFLRDGRQELLTPGDGEARSALYAVLGRELALGMIPVNGSGEEGVAVSGFVSLPVCCRGSRGSQFFFVNGRPVKSPLLTAAVEGAYANQKMVGRFPGCVLYLTTRLNGVDVNVHPAKTEVKFGSERRIHAAVYYAVQAALGGDRTRPAAEVARPKGHDTVTPNQTVLSAPAAGSALTLADPLARGGEARAAALDPAALRREAARARTEGRLADRVGEHRPGPPQSPRPRSGESAPVPPVSRAGAPRRPGAARPGGGPGPSGAARPARPPGQGPGARSGAPGGARPLAGGGGGAEHLHHRGAGGRRPAHRQARRPRADELRPHEGGGLYPHGAVPARPGDLHPPGGGGGRPAGAAPPAGALRLLGGGLRRGHPHGAAGPLRRGRGGHPGHPVRHRPAAAAHRHRRPRRRPGRAAAHHGLQGGHQGGAEERPGGAGAGGPGGGHRAGEVLPPRPSGGHPAHPGAAGKAVQAELKRAPHGADR